MRMLVLTLSTFKKVNLIFGHPVLLAERLNSTLKYSDKSFFFLYLMYTHLLHKNIHFER